MSEHLISLYIDDELDLDLKIDFVEIIHADKGLKDEAVDLLRQEKLLRAEVVHDVPALRLGDRRNFRQFKRFRPLVAMAAGLAAAVLLVFAWRPPGEPPLRPHRFVIYQPEARSVEIAGSFTGWKKVPLSHSANSGYWEVTLDLPEGDHRFSYIIGGGRRLTDPTLAVRETDDFGGENSILTVKL